MAQDNVSPEERLFKLIKKNKETPAAEAKPGLRKAGRFFAGLKLGPALGGAHLKFQEIDLKTINKALITVLCLFAAFVAYYTVNNRASVARLVSAIASVQLQPLTTKEVETLRPLSFYRQEIRKRDIFRPAPKVDKKVVSSAREKLPAEKLTEKVKDLSLKGIAWGALPKAIIKNEKEDKVYFLKEGQLIGSTGIVLKRILKNKVVLGYKDGETELQ